LFETKYIVLDDDHEENINSKVVDTKDAPNELQTSGESGYLV